MAPKSLRVFLLAVAAAVPLLGQGCSSSSSDNTTGPSPVIAMTTTSSGDGQTAQVGTALPSPLRVVVTLNGAPQVGTTVSWAAQGTGASVAPTTSLTDANGIATTTWTLGSAAGTQHATATLAGASGSPVTFSATASAAPVPLIGMATPGGDGQSAAAGTALPNPLRVIVTLSGNPVQGDTVRWAAGAGSVAPAKSVTDASGIATTTWTLGSTGGAQSATATLAGATGSPVSFSATAILPLIAKTASASGDAQTGTVAATLADSLRVLVTFSGAAQAGDTVVWAAAGVGASVNPLKSVTDASGIASTTWTLGQTAGSQSATATMAGATGSPVGFTATGTAGPATQIAATSGDNQTALVSTVFGSPLVVKISDQFGNAVAGDTVTWLSLHGVAVVAPAKSASGATGTAQASLTAGAAAGVDTITATATGLAGSPVRFAASVTTASTTASVNVGNFFFKSVRNNSQNPAVDTIAAGGTVTWNFTAGTHGAQSTGSPSFAGQQTVAQAQSSGTFAVQFTVAGTYQYDCVIHGAAMTGTIVVR